MRNDVEEKTMIGLAALLIPLIPPMINGLLNIVDAIKDHDSTPEALKTQLAGISDDLRAINARVQAVELPS